MQPAERAGGRELKQLLDAAPVTRGLVARVSSERLTVGRPGEEMDDGTTALDHRVRLTRLAARTFGLSVQRHYGRWERTPFTGTIAELVDVIVTLMQHLVAA